MRRPFFLATLFLGSSACLATGTRAGLDRTYDAATRRIREPEHEVASALPDLSDSIDRSTVVALAVSRSPSLAALAHRARAAVHAARAEGALPAPELGLEAWNLPLARPYRVGEADMYMVELRQRFPAAGSRDARARATSEEATALLADLSAEERAVAQRAADAYADYAHGLADHALHRTHLALVEAMQSAIRARVTTGGATIADAARIDLEIAKTRRNIARVDGDVARSRAILNSLLRRPVDEPLGTPVEQTAMTVRRPIDELLEEAERTRGAGLAAESRENAARAQYEAARAEARRPEVAVGLGYWQDPMRRPGVGANVAMSLPWLYGPARHRLDEAHELEASASANHDAATLDARAEVTEAHANLAAFEAELVVVHESALPAARRSIEAVHAAYATGHASLLEWIDAARSILDLAMEEADLTAELARGVAALERAVGASIPATPVFSEDPP